MPLALPSSAPRRPGRALRRRTASCRSPPPAAAVETDELYPRPTPAPRTSWAGRASPTRRDSPAPVATECLREYGIAFGTTSGSFEFGEVVTRRQMASFSLPPRRADRAAVGHTPPSPSPTPTSWVLRRRRVYALAERGDHPGPSDPAGAGLRARRAHLPGTRWRPFLNRFQHEVLDEPGGFASGLAEEDLVAFSDDEGVFQDDIRAVASAAVAQGHRRPAGTPPERHGHPRADGRASWPGVLDREQDRLRARSRATPVPPYRGGRTRSATSWTGSVPGGARESSRQTDAGYVFVGLRPSTEYTLDVLEAAGAVRFDGQVWFKDADGDGLADPGRRREPKVIVRPESAPAGAAGGADRTRKAP